METKAKTCAKPLLLNFEPHPPISPVLRSQLISKLTGGSNGISTPKPTRKTKDHLTIVGYMRTQLLNVLVG